MPDEHQDTEQQTIESSSTPSPEQTTTQTVAGAETDTSDDFDAAYFEAEFGMPEGSLAEAKTPQEATAIIKEYADSMLTAGFTYKPEPQQMPQPGAQAASAPAKPAKKEGEKEGEKPEAPSNPELDALRAELQEVKSVLQSSVQAEQERLAQAVEQRLLAEIDKWESPKYGKGNKRNYNQIQAVKKLRDMAATHFRGYLATGKPVPSVEALMRQVRAFDDDTYTPGQKASQKPQETLGTPGSSRNREADNQPSNIHTALMGKF